MLGPFLHAPSADEKGTKVAWAVAWPVLVMGTVMTLLYLHSAPELRLSAHANELRKGAEGLPAGNGDPKDSLTSVASVG